MTSMGNRLVTIASDDDWDLLRDRNATSVIDPMVVRVADLFARGRSAGGPDAWSVIKGNLVNLATFVDAVVLEPGIPVFDYWYTGEEWGQDLALFDYTDPVLVPVGVTSNVWSPIATESWTNFHDKPRLPQAAAADIATRLRQTRWTFITSRFGAVDISESESAGDKSGDALVNSYLYVTLLFAGYAARLGDDGEPGAQILSPSQARMFVATAAAERAGRGRPLPEGATFGKIEDILDASREGYERTWRSKRLHFLPYLLSLEDRQGRWKVRTPQHLFSEAVELRHRADVSAYRDRLHDAEARLEHGQEDVAWVKELQRAKRAVQTSLKLTGSVETLDIHVGIPWGVGISTQLDTSPLRDWLLQAWPGRRYRRVLTRLVAAQTAANQIDRAIERVWRAG
jgi:hypothetical protein